MSAIGKKGPCAETWGRKLAHHISKSELETCRSEKLCDVLRLLGYARLPFLVCFCAELSQKLPGALCALCHKQPQSCKALGSTLKAPRLLCLPSTGGTRSSVSEDARTAGLGGFLGYCDPAGSLLCIGLLDLMVLQLLWSFQLRSVGLEDSKEWAVSGLVCWANLVVLCWLGVVVMVGKCIALVSPGHVVKNSGLLRSTFHESHCLIRGKACARSWKCILSQPWAKKIKTDSRECLRKRWKCKHYIT